MQSDEVVAQNSRLQASDIRPSSLQRAASLALSSSESRWNCTGDGESRQFVVLLVRKENQGE